MTIEQLARRFVEAIETVHPEGPYRLAGYCAGGVTAYETACQLESRGKHLSLLTIIEGDLSHHTVKNLPSLLHQIIVFGESLPFWF